MAEASHSVEEYKQYIRELKSKVRRLQEKNKELATEVVSLKNGELSKQQDRAKVSFALLLNQKIVRAQASWRGILARREFKKMIKDTVRREEEAKAKLNTNQSVMNRARDSAEALNMTLEMLHRAADTRLTGSVALDDFKNFLVRIKLKLSPAQMSRYSSITKIPLLDRRRLPRRDKARRLLPDFGCLRGQLRVQLADPTLDHYFVRATVGLFHLRCMIKLAKALKNQILTPSQFSLLLDSPNRGKISSTSLMSEINKLKMEFKEREKYSILNYIDPSRSGEFDERHLIKELEKAVAALQDPTKTQLLIKTDNKKELKPIIDPKKAIGSSTIGLLDSGVREGGDKPVVPGGRELSEVAEINIKNIIKKIELRSPLSVFLVGVFDNCKIKENKLDLNDFNGFLVSNYSLAIGEIERQLLIKTIDANRDGKVDISELKLVAKTYQFFRSFIKDNSVFLQLTLKIIGKELDAAKVSTGDYLTSNRP